MSIYETWLGSAVIMSMALLGLREYVKEHPNQPALAETPIDENDVRRWQDERPVIVASGPQFPHDGSPSLPNPASLPNNYNPDAPIIYHPETNTYDNLKPNPFSYPVAFS